MKQNSHQTSLFELRDLFVRHRELTWAMAKREFTGRYAGQFFGVFWGFAHPAMLIVIYASVFSLVFKVRVGGTREMPLDYTTYLLSGLIPWLAFSESMSRSTGIILEHTSLVKQVAFPIAVLPLKTVISSLITQAVFTIFLLSYVALRHNTFFLTWGLLPVLFIIQGSGDDRVGIYAFLRCRLFSRPERFCPAVPYGRSIHNPSLVSSDGHSAEGKIHFLSESFWQPCLLLSGYTVLWKI